MNDNEFTLHWLEAGPQTTMDLILCSQRFRGCGLTPHSRVADLRRQGHDIRCRRLPGGRRPVYEYTLVREPVQLELTGRTAGFISLASSVCVVAS